MFRFAIVVSRFNEEITEGLLRGAQEFFAMSMFIKGQPYGLLYADGGAVRPQLGERDYGAFKNLCLAANEALARLAD